MERDIMKTIQPKTSITEKKVLSLRKRGKIDTVITQENVETCIYISCEELSKAGICGYLDEFAGSGLSLSYYRCKGKNKQPISSDRSHRPRWCPLLRKK